MKRITLLLPALLLVGTVYAQSELTLKTRIYRQQNERRLLDEFIGLLALPNVVYDTVGIQQTATYIADMLKRRGIEPQRLDGRTKGVPPGIYGEVIVPGATKTVVFYAHYDGQPVNPNQWADGLKPFEPTLYSASLEAGGKAILLPKAGEPINPDWRIYGRSTSDDKAGVFAILAAYDALVNLKIKPTVNLKFFFEGEEEAGSTHLSEILERHKDRLKSDLWIICDGPVHQTGRKQVLFGVRGDVNLELKVFASKRPLHSGHYGNWAPNPAMMLARLLTSMKDE
ncbi:MAG TPA: M20/M25/M40 family metallo-hydrolase, partial [Fibrella sp.]